MHPKVVYPEMPELQFKNDEEKRIFSEIHNWLFEIENELDEENRVILDYKRNKLWDNPQNIFLSNFPEDDEEEEEENDKK